MPGARKGRTGGKKADDVRKPFLARLKALVFVHAEPVRVAGSFAVALGCGTAPYFIGLALSPLLVWWFRLNKYIAVGATALLLANPLGVVVMFIQAWLGLRLLGRRVPAWILHGDTAMLRQEAGYVRDLLLGWLPGGAPARPPSGAAWDLLVAYSLGGAVWSISLGLASFLLLWGFLEWRRRRREERGARHG
jgi:uncharacterized protein (DUF2062 family)